ncbi:hypothetical protein [Caballeronia mineralivorans]|jgi:hypothetical protein|uniref:hypothetical protein n=1 Tax=Caballeronia mineralivorans TaxID=2010198 RepID=UPI0023F0E1F3|nr:hypothetical protein [Caballeronia mineralivorans]
MLTRDEIAASTQRRGFPVDLVEQQVFYFAAIDALHTPEPRIDPRPAYRHSVHGKQGNPIIGHRVLIKHMTVYMVVVDGRLELHSLPLADKIPAHQNLLVRVPVTTGIEKPKGASVCRFSRNTRLLFQQAFVHGDAWQTRRR